MVKTFDPACYDLAEHFLQDEPCANNLDLYKKHCRSMALAIQQAVENWLAIQQAVEDLFDAPDETGTDR